jgi:membrane protease YdiL (CAAX protease family)
MAWALTLSIVVWPFLVARVTAAMVASSWLPDRGLGAPLVFFLATVAPLVPIIRSSARRTIIQVGKNFALGLLAFGAFLSLGPPVLSVGSAVALFIVAFQEEVVFRLVLPRALTQVTRVRAGLWAFVLAGVLASVAFSLAHLRLNGLGIDVGRLFVVTATGILLLCLTRLSGLWVAAVVHAAVNLAVVRGSPLLIGHSVAYGVVCFLASCLVLTLVVMTQEAVRPSVTRAVSRPVRGWHAVVAVVSSLLIAHLMDTRQPSTAWAVLLMMSAAAAAFRSTGVAGCSGRHR